MIKKIKNIKKTINKIQNNILIYQMGKVGSVTLCKSIEKLNISYETYHTIHKHIKFNNFKKYKALNIVHKNSPYLKFSRNFKNSIKIKLFKRAEKAKIITIVREPISRNIAFYFEDFYIPLLEKNLFGDFWVLDESLNYFISDFKDNFNHTVGINWFDEELKRHIGVDVYDYEFDKKQGYTVIEKDKLNIMVIQLEKLNSLEKEIGEFIGNKDFVLENANVSGNKWYKPVYKEFKENIEFSKKYVDDLYNSKFMKHFYSDEDIEKFRNKLNIV